MTGKPVEPHGPSAPLDSARLVIRPGRIEDRDQVCDHLAAAFPNTPRERWTRVFDYAWVEDKPDYGMVAEIEGRIVGYGAIVHSHRIRHGRTIRFAAASGWWVDREYRSLRIAKRMVDRFFVEYADRTLTFLTQRPDHRRFWRRYPGRPFDDRRRVMPVRPPLWAGQWPVEIPQARVTAELVGEEPGRIFADHLPLRCEPQAFRDETSACVVIARRRAIEVPLPGWYASLRRRVPLFDRWLAQSDATAGIGLQLNRLRGVLSGVLPTAEVLYVSNPDFFRRWREPLIRKLCRRHRALAVAVDERRVGMSPESSRGWVVPGHYYYHSNARDVLPADVDALYSEIVLLH